LQILEHTADEGIRVTGPTRQVVFERAAWGMFSLLTDPDSVAPLSQWRVEVTGDSDEALLVAWLSELNVMHQLQRIVFSSFQVQSYTAGHLRAIVFGEDYDPGRHPLHKEIKAVTYCACAVRRVGSEWMAQVVVDV